jgi:nitrite reductase/ring-hydroxylating ferredoxin subunit
MCERGTRRYRHRMTNLVRAVPIADIPDGQGKLWRHGDKRIALFRTAAGVYAADNRCPHQGYALKDGDIRGDVLTCAWHNWKFRLTDGKCVFGGENIRTYPVSVRDGWVYVDTTDPAPEEIAPELFASLLDAMGDVDTGRLARDTMRLRAIGTPLTEVVRAGVTYGATRAEYGWNHSLATLADCLTMAAAFEGPLSALPVIQGLSTMSRTEVRRPPRPQPDPIDVVACYGSVADGLAAFPPLIDAEQGEEAEALLRGLLVAGASPGEIRHAFLCAITDHFLGYGHPMIYCQKAFDLLDRIGWSQADTVLAPLVPAITWSTRYDRLPYMRRFLRAWRATDDDPDARARAARDRGPAAVLGHATTAVPGHALTAVPGHAPTAVPGHATTLAAPDPDIPGLRRVLLDGMPEDAVAAVTGAVRGGVPVPHIIDAIASVAAARLGRFDIASDTDDSKDAGWLDVTHTLTYTNALRWAWSVDPGPQVLRGVLHAAWFVQWTSKFDARAEPAPVAPYPGSKPDAVLAAIRKRDPDQAVALVKGYDGPAAPLETALTQAAAEDNSTASIMVAHAVKTTTAAIAESRAGPAGRAPLAAAARFLAAPKRERFVYQATLDAIDFIQGRAKGDTDA